MKLFKMQFPIFLFSIPFLAGCTVSKKNGSESKKSSISCELFCNETMIFRAKMNRDELVANALYYNFDFYTFSRRINRFREKLDRNKCIIAVYCRLFCNQTCNQTMIFTAKLNGDELVANAIYYLFALYTFSPRMHRFRDRMPPSNDRYLKTKSSFL